MFDSLLADLFPGDESIQQRTEGIAFLAAAKAAYPLTSLAYLGINIPVGAKRQRYIHCTYSDQWVKQAVRREPLGIGTLGGLALALRGPLDWTSLPPTSESLALLQHAKPLSAEQRVLSFPLRTLCGETAIFCVISGMSPAEWEAQEKLILRDFQVLANYFHQHILRIYGNDADNEILMSARELDCLKWMAAGKTAWESSVILGISERTVRFHLNAAREKLNCLTTTQAVAKAVSQQLIVL
jgi:DNA-binding CsgD family transcriptional regulator